MTLNKPSSVRRSTFSTCTNTKLVILENSASLRKDRSRMSLRGASTGGATSTFLVLNYGYRGTARVLAVHLEVKILAYRRMIDLKFSLNWCKWSCCKYIVAWISWVNIFVFNVYKLSGAMLQHQEAGNCKVYCEVCDIELYKYWSIDTGEITPGKSQWTL